MFDTIIVQPIFNLLVLIYALIPGHNFGLAIIIFTLVTRLLLWPLLRKQLHQAKAMRALQPELKKIKQSAKGDKQKESALLMELYKERGINPFSQIGIILAQLPILLGLYSSLNKLVHDHGVLIDFSYPFVRNLSWIKELGSDLSKFDNTLIGSVDLGQSAIPKTGGIYWPAMIIVAASALVQYYQSKQLMPNDKDAKSLRSLLKSAGEGKQADASETNAAVGRSMRYFIPAIIFIIGLNLPAALPLYWLAGGLIAIVQQRRILGQDEVELETAASSSGSAIIEGEIVTKATPAKKKKKPSAQKSKRRKK